MRFLCPCGRKELRVADEKLPAAEVFAMRCPECRKKLVVDQGNPDRPARFAPGETPPESPSAGGERSSAGKGAASSYGVDIDPGLVAGLAPAFSGHETPEASKTPEGARGAAGTSGGEASDDRPARNVTRSSGGKSAGAAALGASVAGSGSDAEPEIFPPGASTALVFLRDAGARGAVMEYLRERGYFARECAAPDEAAMKLRRNAYDLVIMDEAGAGAASDSDPWAEILELSGLQRREMNCVMVGDAADTGDPARAFSLAANYCVNASDLRPAGAAPALDGALKAYATYYQELNAARQAMAAEAKS